ncbi:MAG: hypothetical protein NC319_04075 [Butyricicoccus sp.]|nr:hypothetical protein [Butyricicoccus sp.]
MEVRATGQVRRNGQLDKQPAKKADARPAARNRKSQTPDRCTLSRQALEYLGRRNAIEQELAGRRARQQSAVSSGMSEMESRKKQLDLMEKALDVMRKCMKIAASVMKGNKVPPEDLKYLMENDPEGCKMALAMRRDDPDPEKEKSVLDDEDRNGGAVDSAGAGPAAVPEVQAAEPSGDIE